jgi:hypothetical protein
MQMKVQEKNVQYRQITNNELKINKPNSTASIITQVNTQVDYIQEADTFTQVNYDD